MCRRRLGCFAAACGDDATSPGTTEAQLALDFTDLELRARDVLRKVAGQGRALDLAPSALLVDEFQDTNPLQLVLVKLLTCVHGNLFVVGDDDQSIYSWRGARIENMLNFDEYFPGAVTFRLEQNYRSTGNILNAANGVIANNKHRKGKNLWTSGSAGRALPAGTPSRL